MANLFTIIAVLFFSLFIVIYLLERFGSNAPNEKIMKMSRYIMPLMGVVLLLMALRFFFSG